MQITPGLRGLQSIIEARAASGARPAATPAPELRGWGPTAANEDRPIEFGADGLMSIYAVLPEETRTKLLGLLREVLGHQEPTGPTADASGADPGRFFGRDGLSFEDAILLAMVTLMNARQGEIEEDARALSAAEDDEGQASDVKATMFNRKVDVRNNLFQVLRGLVESFQKSADSVTQSMAR